MKLETTESQRLRFQNELDAQRTAEERNRWGQFATPPELAREIADYVASFMSEVPRIRFLEPALGSGAFFSALLTTITADRLASAVGIELDERFATVATDLWSEKGLKVVPGDFTTLASDLRNFNLVLTNPPYVRHHHLDGATKARLQHGAFDASGIRPSGLSGLYVYFMLLAHQCMAEGGIGAWLVPTEFMDVNYGSALRTYLTERVTLERIHRFSPDDGQFSDALVTSAVVVFRHQPPSDEHLVEFTVGGTVTRPDRTRVVSVGELRSSRKWTHVDSAAERKTSGVPLGELFNVRRGIATGANSFFIISRERAQDLGLPQEFLRPILPSPRHLSRTIVEADSDGYPVLDRQLCLLDCPLPEHEVKARYPRLWEYLLSGIRDGVSDRYLSRSRTPWYRQERRERAPFLVSYMGRNSGNGGAFSIIWNRSKAIATNVYLMLYPKDMIAEYLQDEPEAEEAIYEALRRMDDNELRKEGRVYGGGLHKIEPKELERLLITTLNESIWGGDIRRAIGGNRQLNLW